MSRLPIATDLKTRTGAPSTKDARQVNSYIEVKGNQAAVRKRPAAQGGIALGTGTAQGGIGMTVNGTPTFFGFWGDTMQTYTGGGTSWNSGTSYLTGDHVTVNFVDYWAINNNTNSQPPSGNWSRTYVPSVPAQNGWVFGTTTAKPDIYSNHSIAWNGSIYCFINSVTGTSYTSSDGLIWTSHLDTANLQLSPGNNWMIVYGNGKFCAVNPGAAAKSVTSTDGITWTSHSSASLGVIADIATNNSIFVAVDTAGVVVTSTDGITWTSRGSILYGQIEWNGTIFCIVSSGGGAFCKTSSDGITWSGLIAMPSGTWFNLRNLGSVLCAAKLGSPATACSIDNGATWTSGTLPINCGNLMSGLNKFVAFSALTNTGTYATSTDGINWTSQTISSIQAWAYGIYGANFVIISQSNIDAVSQTGLP